MQELKFLFVTLVTTGAGSYFLIGIIDYKEEMISGLREIKEISEYGIYTFDGFSRYFKDVVNTYLNSVYYSIAVMSTLGDSKIVLEGGFARVIVAIQVVMTVSLTVFKIGEFYREQSSKEAKKSEARILDSVSNISKSGPLPSKQGLWSRVKMKLTRGFR